MKSVLLKENEIDRAADFLKQGEVVVFPTETVFGIGVVYDDEDSFKALVNAKHRSPDKPFTLMCHSVEEALSHSETDEKIASVFKKFLPGELTILVKAKNNLPEWVTLGTGILGIRVPDSLLVNELLSKVGKPCLVTSANISGQKTVVSAQEALQVFGDEIAAALIGHPSSNVPSTIIDLTGEEPKLVRQGALSFDTIVDYWRSL